MATDGLDPVNRELVKELRDIQSQFFDKSSNYTKLIFGLAYGGFFAFWGRHKTVPGSAGYRLVCPAYDDFPDPFHSV